MMDTVLIVLAEVVEEGHHHDLGSFESRYVPRIREHIQWEGLIFVVEHVIWTPTLNKGFCAAVVTVKFVTTAQDTIVGETPEQYEERHKATE